MSTSSELRNLEIARGLRIKRTNAIFAILAGIGLGASAIAIGSVVWRDLSGLQIVLGTAVGLIYANAFEYILHRFVLHWGNGFLVQRHALHHDSAGTPEEPRYVNFAGSPSVVIMVFVLNALPVLAIERWLIPQRLGPSLTVGIFAGFTIYYVAYEEVHWRIHLGRLPAWLQFARRHHMLHHGEFEGRYNVFLPFFDWIFHRSEWKRQRVFKGSD